MKRNIAIIALFLVGVGCFTFAAAAVLMGVAGVFQQLSRWEPIKAMKIVGGATLMAGAGIGLGLLAVNALNRLRGASMAVRGFDVLPPR